MRYQAPRGTHDVLPSESPRWRHLEHTFAELAELYGYQELRTPVFEDTDLFVRSSGETSEVVSKQMYSFVDKGERELTLKPEGTAPAIRAYLEHKLGGQGQVTRLWYATPIFRYERPQKGRYRQAHQVGMELIGSASPSADAEVIEMTVRFYERLGITQLRVLINSIGRDQTRSDFRQALLEHVKGWLEQQDEGTQARALKNPLRMLDSKDPELQQVLQGAPRVLDYLEPASRSHFEELRARLDDFGIRYALAPEIVRGLDYYTDTVFEVQSEGLGSQNALCGGGRYDNLIEQLGGPSTPSVGVAMGVERALLVQEAQGVQPTQSKLAAYLVASDQEGRKAARRLAAELRQHHLSCAYDLDERGVKAQFKQADRLGARYAVVLLEEELASESATIKNLETGEQSKVPLIEVRRLLQGL